MMTTLKTSDTCSLVSLLRRSMESAGQGESALSNELAAKFYLEWGKAQATINNSLSISASFDLATVLKASQTLSSEIQLDRLLATLLQTVMENAGADQAALLMPHEETWFVEAVSLIDQPAKVDAIALTDSSEVPHGLVRRMHINNIPAIDYLDSPQPSTLCSRFGRRGQSLI